MPTVTNPVHVAHAIWHNREIPHLSERIAALLKGLPPADQKRREMMGERRAAFLVDQSFRVTNLALQSGQVVSCLLLREEGEVLIVADSQGREVCVPKTSVEERSTAQLSPMPANMADQIALPEFNDLMSYLLKHRDEKAPR